MKYACTELSESCGLGKVLYAWQITSRSGNNLQLIQAKLGGRSNASGRCSSDSVYIQTMNAGFRTVLRTSGFADLVAFAQDPALQRGSGPLFNLVVCILLLR